MEKNSDKENPEKKKKIDKEDESNDKNQDHTANCLSTVNVNYSTKNEKEDEDKGNRLQMITEIISLIIMFIGFSLAMITPWFLLAIFTFPGPYTPYFKTAIWTCCLLSLICIIIGSFLGNVVWHYDESKTKWRFFFHCGSSKTRHHWGDSFFKLRKNDDIIVEYL
ncbi:uncharacterized protein LOC111634747 [Centruroides sculpturatus]|uniref:uncharacterized protein LOC111634747 n=1 Tax=Centruroides sculpturatus TaxID=218467 RepID=UPI000C6D2F7D|nr:uncharacterized protein LOC111634747 [Centruroides sculpturatus]